VRGRHQGDLVWRFQHADEQVRPVPSALAVLANICMRCSVISGGEASASISDVHLAAVERKGRIDTALGRLPTKPVNLARVLFLRYGGEEEYPESRLVLRENAGVAAIAPAAAKWFARREGKPPRPRSNDVRHWLASLCSRFSTHEANAVDTMVMDDVRRGADALLAEAESAYETAAEHALAAWLEIP